MENSLKKVDEFTTSAAACDPSLFKGAAGGSLSVMPWLRASDS
jgi:hypothetical protein